jgi:hypothetical protein
VKTRHLSILIIIQTLVIFTLTNYGGLRSPDSEIVFREAEAIAHTGDISIAQDLESWPGFGVARGNDGRLYSIYPPVESFVLAPIIAFIEKFIPARSFEEMKFPVSHYVGFGVRSARAGIVEKNGRANGVRFYSSFFDVGISVLNVFVFWLLLLRLTTSPAASYSTTTVYAFGTFTWSYAGSLFSEPLATLFVLLSFFLLLIRAPLTVLLSGIFLALALGTHMTAVLFVPFFFLALVGSQGDRSRLSLALVWGAGLGAVSLYLAYYNWFRFGNIFESGRNLSSENPLTFVSLLSASFFDNLFHLVVSPGKGLLIICPAVIVGLLTWRFFHIEYPCLSAILVAAIITRLIFIAHYADWHAGFALGPRYLYMIVPFLLIPVAFWLKRQGDNVTIVWGIAGGIWLLIVQQWYFALGEIFSFYYSIDSTQSARGVDVYVNDRIFRDWQFSPLFHFLDNHRGPYFLQTISLSNQALWLSGSFLILVVIVAATYYFNRPVAFKAGGR